jgi:ligand-binding sensor domain-containing protein
LKINTFILLFFIYIAGFTQQNYVHYTVKDGLAQMQCMKLFQDSKGYIWIATKGGVSKYDGIQFKNYGLNEGLPNNRIFTVNEDANENIWAFTTEGVSVLKGDNFVYFPPKDKNLRFDIVNTGFLIDVNNQIWIIDSSRKKLILFANGTYKTTFNAKTNNLEVLYNLSYDDANGKIYFNGMGSNKKTSLFTININSLKATKINLNFDNINHKESIAFKYKMISSNKHIINIYQIGKKDTTKLVESTNGFNHITRLNDSTLIYTTGEIIAKMPLYYLINGKHKTQNYIANYYNQINDILKDSENNIWIASEKGLFKLTAFNNFTTKENMPNYVWTIQEDDNKKLWFSSYANAHLSYRENGKIYTYPKTFNQTGFFLGALKTSSNTILFSHRKKIISYDGKKFSSFKLPDEAYSFSMFEDLATKNIYFGTNKGLYIKSENGAISKNENFNTKIHGAIHEMIKNNKNEIWYVSRKSIGIIDKTSIKIKLDAIKGAVALFKDYKDNLWIGTESGLFFYNYHKFIKIKHNELNNFILSIKATDQSHFVYGGMRGIGILDIEAFYKMLKHKINASEINAQTIVNYYTQSHGFLGEEVGQNGIFKDSKNQIWIPTNNNVVMFNPKDLKKNTKAPYTYITKLQYSKDNINWKTIKDSISYLNYLQCNIQLSFTGISHTSPDMVKYKYRLKGFNDTWSNETKKREVTFTNLEPKSYSFEVLASNSNGVWNKRPVIRNFTIVPIFWQTWWFKFLMMTFILFAIYKIIQLVYLRKRRKVEINERLNNLQLKAIQSQLYPHLLFNAVSATGSVIYKENKEKAYDFVVKLSKFMRSALEDSKKLYKSIQEELNFVESYLQLQKIRFSERFNYEIIIDDAVDLSIKIPQMTIQTYVENAVKHGLEPLKKGGLLKIFIVKKGNGIQFIIEDNGIGIEQAKKSNLKGTGSGIKIMNEIYSIHNEKGNSNISFEFVDLFKNKERGTKSIIHMTIN